MAGYATINHVEAEKKWGIMPCSAQQGTEIESSAKTALSGFWTFWLHSCHLIIVGWSGQVRESLQGTNLVTAHEDIIQPRKQTNLVEHEQKKERQNLVACVVSDCA